MQAVILAGGQGTRLKSIQSLIPKPMIPIGDMPLLEHQIILLKKYGISDIFILVNYLKDAIISYFGNGDKWGVSIQYYEEAEPLGTVGGVKAIEHLLTDDFLVLYGDVMLDVDLKRLLAFHKQKKSDCTLVLHPNDHPYDSDLVDVDNHDRIVHFYSKPHQPDQYYRNLVNAGVYLFTGRIFAHLVKGKKADFGKDIFPNIHAKLRMFGYNTTEYIKDMGTPDRLEKVNRDYRSGKINRKSYDHLQKTIFLDRDGVLNPDKHLIARPEDFELYPNTAEAIKKINQSDYQAIVVTNQPVVARNLCTEAELQVIHNKLDTLLGKEHAMLDAIYYCPHHPDKGFVEENKAYKIECECRKPKPGMLLKAAEQFNIDLTVSYIIGDDQRDIEAGINAGVTTVGVRTGKGLKNTTVYPDYFFSTLNEAVDFIVEDPYLETFKRLEDCFRKSERRPYVILLDGSLFSGKSTLASYLKKSFSRLGIQLFSVNLAYWLKQNETGGILQVSETVHELKEIIRGKPIQKTGIELVAELLPSTEYHFKNEEIFLIEGSHLLEFAELREMVHLRLFKDLEKDVFIKRAKNFFYWKGRDEKEIDVLVKELATKQFNRPDFKHFADIIV